jgi:serine/threonine protein kinase
MARKEPNMEPSQAIGCMLTLDYDGNFQTLHELGRGACGVVNLVKHTQTKQVYAAKLITPGDGRGRDLLSVHREVEILATVAHGAVLSLRGETYSAATKCTVFLTDYMPNGSCFDIANRPGIDWTPTRRFIVLLGVAAGMKYLHSLHIMHRDLKPANILLNGDFEPAIADFGFAKIDPTNGFAHSMTGGTRPYMAPELFRGDDQYDREIDVYAYGMVMFELLTGIMPYKGVYKSDFELQMRVLEGKRPSMPASVPQALKSLITACWAQDPKDRPTFDEVLRFLLTDPNCYADVDRVALFEYAARIAPQDYLLCAVGPRFSPVDSIMTSIRDLERTNTELAGRAEELKSGNKLLIQEVRALEKLVVDFTKLAGDDQADRSDSTDDRPGRRSRADQENPEESGLLQQLSAKVQFVRLSNEPTHLLAGGSKIAYASPEAKRDTWIQFEFIDKVSLTAIVLTSYPTWALKSWKLMAYFSDKSRRVLYETEAEEGLKSEAPVTITFPECKPRFIRICQAGPAWTGHNRFGLVSVQFEAPRDQRPIDTGRVRATCNDCASLTDVKSSVVVKTFTRPNSLSALQVKFSDGVVTLVGYEVKSVVPEHRYTFYGSASGSGDWQQIDGGEEKVEGGILKVRFPRTGELKAVKLELQLPKSALAISHLELFGSWIPRARASTAGN